MTTPTRISARGDSLKATLLGSAVLLEGLSMSSANLQLPSIASDLDAGPRQLQLVVTGFLGAFAGTLLVGGRLSDRIGARSAFRLGLLIFLIGSVIALAANSVAIVTTGRVVQGVGAGLTTPAAFAVIASEFAEGPSRSRALALMSSMGAAGFSCGVLVGHLATQAFGWRGVFGFYAATVPMLVIAARQLLPPTAQSGGGSSVRAVPAAAVVLGLLSLVIGLGAVESDPVPGTTAAVLGMALVVAVAALDARSAEPLAPPAVTGLGGVRRACLGLGWLFFGVSGITFAVSATLPGHFEGWVLPVVLLVQAGAVALASTAVGRRPRSNPVTPTLLGWGVLASCLGIFAYGIAIDHRSVLGVVLAAGLVGLGVGVAYPLCVGMVTSAAPTQYAATANGLLITAQQALGAMGVAVTAILVSSTIGRSSWLACASLATATLTAYLVSIVLWGRDRRVPHAREETPDKP